MTDEKPTDAGKKIEPLPSIKKAKKVMGEMQKLKLKTETVNFLKGLPPMLMQNGLGQTIAFMKSKSGDNNDYGKILTVFTDLFGKEDLMAYLVTLNNPKEYLQMQKDAIEYAGWVKKFALAFYVEQKKEKKDGTAAS